jgi:transcription initiation factor TFIID subunit 1, fungi type
LLFNKWLKEETDIISTLTGFGLDNVLSGLDLPSGPALSNRLGISGLTGITKQQIYNETWDDDGAIGAGEGEDWEEEVDRELEEEQESDGAIVKTELESPRMGRKEKNKRIIRRLVERPKTVYERFPTFERDKVLDFTELFKGYTVPKSRISKRPFHRRFFLPCMSLYMKRCFSRDGVPSQEGSTKKLSRCCSRRSRTSSAVQACGASCVIWKS